MKKLISIFAAMALVGSMAAAPKKPAAKPAVAAPAAAAPVAAVAASVPKSSGKGMGLFIEGRGSFSLSNGSSTAQGSGDQSTTAGQSISYQLSNAAGFGGGGTIGFNFLENLGIVASFDYRSIKSREWSQSNAAAGTVAFGDTQSQTNLTNAAGVAGLAGGATILTQAVNKGDAKIQNTKNTMVLGLGLRPTVALGPGALYAGAGVAFVLPYDDTTSVTYTGTGGTSNSITSAKGERVIKYGMAIGAYGELGYNFNITDNLYVGLGARILVATANNSGKDRTITASATGAAGTGTSTVTSTASESVANTSPAVTTGTGTSKDVTTTGAQHVYGSDGTTDITAVVNVGFRF